MPRKIPLGIESFIKLRQDDYFYIDKTGFIKDWWNSADEVTLITRPRHFGKTVMLDTVNTFFSPDFAGSSLFEGLKIWEDEKFRNIQGTIPVMFLSFANIRSQKYDEAVEDIKYNLWRVYESSKQFLDPEEKFFLPIDPSMDDATAVDSLCFLIEYIARYYKTLPIILIDEYDKPLHNALLNGYWNQMIEFMHSLYLSTFKDNNYVGKGLITGTTRIDNELPFARLNTLNVYSITSDLYYDSFGFTEEEVFSAMNEYCLTDKENVKRWYDGFIFGSHTNIYNPRSVINYLAEKNFAPYCSKIILNSLVGDLIAKSKADDKDKIIALLQNKTVTIDMDEDIVFSKIDNTILSIWGLLMAEGYIKPIHIVNEYEYIFSSTYDLKITNLESQIIFEKFISDWFNFDNEQNNIEKFRVALLSNKIEDMNIILGKIFKNTFSIFDNRKKYPEIFYTAFVLGLLVDLKGRYEILSNMESIYGRRYDISLVPKDTEDPGIVIGFKTFDEEKNLKDICNNALKQIKTKEYTSDLISRGVSSNNIYAYGFAFRGKKVLICGGSYEKIPWDDIVEN